MIATWKDVYLGPLTAINDAVWPGVRPSVRPDVRPDVRAARVSLAAPKKKSFDRGGPVWPPRSNVTNDHLRGGVGSGPKPPQPKTGGSGGQRPSAKTKNFPKSFRKISKKFRKKGGNG